MSDSGDSVITPYLDYLRYERRLSPRTCESYQRDLKDYLN
jgi:site-specific recombinase XerD